MGSTCVTQITPNTPACESLQSQVNNFTSQFFGAVTKIDVSPGVVEWSLPCDLDLGIPSDPRAFGEGVACYFLRLFKQAIISFEGPAGDNGLAGTDGQPGFTVTMSSFPQPTDSTPFTITYLFTPAIVTGEDIFISNSGWYRVNALGGSGATRLATISLMRSVNSPKATVDAGRIMVPTGPPGTSKKGPSGAPGPNGQTGDKGATGPSGPVLTMGPTEQNGVVQASGSDLNINGAAVPATYGGGTVQVTLPVAGTYLVRAISLLRNNSNVINSALYMYLRNLTDPSKNTGLNGDLPGSLSTCSIQFNGNLNKSALANMACLVQPTSDANTIQLTFSGLFFTSFSAYTKLVWVRLT